MNYVPLFFIPVSLALRYLLDVQRIWVFVAGAAAIGVLAVKDKWMGFAGPFGDKRLTCRF